MKCLFFLALACSFLFNISAQAAVTKHEKFDKEVQDATVKLVCMGPRGQEMSSGSGVRIYHKFGDSWIILTANHVVDECKDSLYVIKDESYRYKLQVIQEDPGHDLAVVKTEKKFFGFYSYMAIAKNKPEIGDTTYIAGYPAPYVELTLTKGIVSGYINMEDFYHGNGKRPMLATDADIFYGNSGGPVYNERWEIVAIVHGAFSDRGYAMGYTTPQESIIEFLKSTPYSFIVED